MAEALDLDPERSTYYSRLNRMNVRFQADKRASRGCGVGIESERHEAYRQLIAQSIHEIYRILSAAEPAKVAVAHVRRQDNARRAVILLAEAVFPLAQASARHFADFDQQAFWLKFEAALRETGEFAHYPQRIRSRNRR